MSLTELDTYYLKSVGSLHSYEHLMNREPSVLQTILEEAIKNKTGIVKDFGPQIASLNNRPLEEIRTTTTHVIEESKTASSSDNELELDLFNEDLMCIICNGMDVAARNRLLECSDCHSLYHQECHRPPVTNFDSDGNRTCQNCKDISKKMKNTPGSSPLHVTPSASPVKPILKNSPPHSVRPSTTSSVPPTYKSSIKPANNVVIPKSTSMTTKSGKPSGSSGSMKASVTPNINIISADKRLQIMKKKAAKLHEKRKQLPR